MAHFLRKLAITFVVSSLVLQAGCRSSTDQWQRVPVHGTVATAEFPDRTEIQGTITFVPADGLEGPAATTGISSGKYSFDPTDGPIAGSHQAIVKIVEPPKANAEPSAASPANPKTQTGENRPGSPKRQKPVYLPDKKVAVQVPGNPPHRLDFDLQ